MSLAVKRSAGAGGADATITSAANWMTQITAAMTAAGWTLLDTLSATDKVYKSTGENGQRAWYVRIFANSNVDWGQYQYQYWDTVGHAGYNALTRAAQRQTTFTAGTYDNLFVVDLDSCAWSMFQGATGYWGTFGWFDPPAQQSMQAVTSTAAGAAGNNVEVQVGTTDPTTRDIAVNQSVVVVAQQTTGPSAGVIPLFTTFVTATRFDGVNYYITLRQIPANNGISSGAIIGQMPHAFISAGVQVLASGYAAGNFASAFKPDGPNLSANMYSAIGGTPSNGFTQWTSRSLAAQTTSGLYNELDPDGRTGRMYILPEGFCSSRGQAGAGSNGYLGSIGKFYRIPKQSDAQWTLYRNIKGSTVRDWSVTNITGSAVRFLLGPIPQSGSVTNLAELVDGSFDVTAWAQPDPTEQWNFDDQAMSSEGPFAPSAQPYEGKTDPADGWLQYGNIITERTATRYNYNNPLQGGDVAGALYPEPFINERVGWPLMSAVIQSDRVVRVQCGAESLRHADATAANDALNVDNWIINGGRVIQSIAFVSSGNQISTFDITVDREWFTGATYTLRVKGVTTSNDIPPDPFQAHDTQQFTGAGTAPTIANAAAGDMYVDVAFSESIDTTTLTKSNFTVTPNGGSGSAVSINSILIVNNTQIRLGLNARMTNGQPYRVTGSTNVKDLVGNPMPGGTHFDFTGLASAANISNITFLDSTHLRLTFTTDVTNDASLINPANYTTTNGLKILAITPDSSRSVVMTTSVMQQGTTYSITI